VFVLEDIVSGFIVISNIIYSMLRHLEISNIAENRSFTLSYHSSVASRSEHNREPVWPSTSPTTHLRIVLLIHMLIVNFGKHEREDLLRMRVFFFFFFCFHTNFHLLPRPMLTSATLHIF
jgi:hypothetical protein